MAEKVVIPEALDEESDFPENIKHYTSLNKLISILSEMKLRLDYSDN